MYGKEVLILPKEETSRTLRNHSLLFQSSRSRGMSWTDKRISLPSFLHGGSGQHSGSSPQSETPESSSSNSHPSQEGGTFSPPSSELHLSTSSGSTTTRRDAAESPRNIKKNLVLTANLRKLKKNKLKWFVLYEDEPGDPRNSAHLDYHDDDKKWRAGMAPKRKIVLNQCLNICRKQDSRDSKNKKVIALYTLEDCVGLLFEQEEELRIWLDLLLSHQQGRNSNGKIPKPNYEYMWQVKVRNFQPESKNSQFSMTGVHRLCVTSDDVKFFPVGSGEPIVFPVDCIRNCATVNRLFRLETGRSSVSGPGLLVIECEDKEIANKINVRVLSSMRESETDQHGSSSRSAPQYNSQRHGSSNCSSSRPRSESWSNHEKPTALPSSAPNSTCMKFPMSGSFIKESSSSSINNSSSKSSLSSNMRHRTTSEGGHFDAIKHRRPLISSSPNSPGPGSFLCSSESAGSSNSIEDPHEGGKLSHSVFSTITPDGNHVTEATIYEESSGESAQDVDRSREDDYLPTSLVDITKAGASPFNISSSKLGRSDKCSNGTALEEDDSYTLMGPLASASDDYMDMSSSLMAPPRPILSTSAFSRISLGPSLDTTSPTSTSSSYPNNEGNEYVEDVEAVRDEEDDDSSSSLAANRHHDVGDYHMISPARASEDMNIPLSDDFSSSYVTMSPVSLDIDKLKSIEEEETCFAPPSSSCRPKIRGTNNTHRNSYCSSTEETPRWSPGPPCFSGGGDPYSPHLPIDPDFPMDPDSNYVPLDFSMIDRHHHDSRGRRISPASSCSIISAGTPSSVEMHQPDKVVSQIIRDDELDDLLLPPQVSSNNNKDCSRNSMRAYSIGSRPEKHPPSLPPLPGKSSRSSNLGSSSSRFIDIPTSTNKSSSSLNNPHNTPTTSGSHQWLKQSPGSSSGHSPSSIMSWIRQRTGSVPSRPPFFERKRHRTQSEGEKDDETNVTILPTPPH